MKTKQKAEELIDNLRMDNTAEGYRRGIKCALVCVDEIQEYITKYDNHVTDFKYWEEVKKELNKIV